MTGQEHSAGETWSSRSVFILAATGAAVGLGNIWRFPYTAGTNGGSAFVLVYILAIVLVAIPIVIAELMIGRRARKSPITDFRLLAEQAGARRFWSLVGWLNVRAVFLILSFYSVIAGWARFANSTLFDLIDYLASNIMLPIGGILIALFAGWIMRGEDIRAEFEATEYRRYLAWRLLIRYVAPLALAVVFAANLV